MLRAVAITILIALSLPARASEEPELVRLFLDRAREACLKAGGTATPEPTVTSFDLTGRGYFDWIVHYDGYCADVPNQFCSAGGCVFQIFRGWPDGRATLMIEQSALRWRAGRVRGLPALILTRWSRFCPRGRRICDETYVFDRQGGMTHLATR